MDTIPPQYGGIRAAAGYLLIALPLATAMLAAVLLGSGATPLSDAPLLLAAAAAASSPISAYLLFRGPHRRFRIIHAVRCSIARRFRPPAPQVRG